METRFFEQFIQLLESRYPKAAAMTPMRERLSPLLFAPHVISLPLQLKIQAQAIVQAFFALRNDPSWQSMVGESAFPDPGNFSALMSYDFHIDENQNLRLIEINTNASMSLLADLLYEMHGLENGFTSDFRKTIVDTFLNEFRLALPSRDTCGRAVIVDEKPQAQRLFAEFRLYQELFERSGLPTEIADIADLRFVNNELHFVDKKIDLIYNRSTDFYLEEDSSAALREAVKTRSVCASPHPFEYRLLADKERLLQLSRPHALDTCALNSETKSTILKTLIKTLDVRDFTDPDTLWNERKRWFFKTKQSYGGKAAYRGASISRSTFSHVINGNYLAQEFVPPSTIDLPTSTAENASFKMDLRFYAYKNEIQLACARLYQGQMTNSQTLGGGIAPIRWQAE